MKKIFISCKMRWKMLIIGLEGTNAAGQQWRSHEMRRGTRPWASVVKKEADQRVITAEQKKRCGERRRRYMELHEN